jgi:hypothetical protein
MPRMRPDGKAELAFTIYTKVPLPNDFRLSFNPFKADDPRGQAARKYLDSLQTISYRTEDSGYEHMIFPILSQIEFPLDAYKNMGAFEIGKDSEGNSYCVPIAWMDRQVKVSILHIDKHTIRCVELEEDSRPKRPLSDFIQKLDKKEWKEKVRG